MRLLAACLIPLGLCLPLCAALDESSQESAAAAVQYGRENLDAGKGLVKDALGIPSIAESSIGYVAACFALGQDVPQAQMVLGSILDSQQAEGPEAGHFPWQGGEGARPNEDAVLYMAPLLGFICRQGPELVGAELHGRLRRCLELATKTLNGVKVAPADETRFLLRAAALGTVGQALGSDGPDTAAGEVGRWVAAVRQRGLSQGHSPTLDAIRLVALKWVYEVAPESARPVVGQALLLASADMASRLHPSLPGLAGAQATAFAHDYLASPGFLAYVLHTDFGYPRPATIEPYIMAALLPSWRAPEALRNAARADLPRLVHTGSVADAPIQATTTWLAPGFSLGTLSGEVGESTIPVYATFAGPGLRRSLYAYCSPAPAHVQAVQDRDLALVSFNFDDIGQGSRKQAWVRCHVGRAEDIEEVCCYGQAWNDLPTSLGERESLAVAMHDCYVGFTLTRVGPAPSQEGPAAKPATLRWSGEGRQGDLTLQVFARQADYALRTPVSDVRAGFVIEVAPRSAYPSLVDFARHLENGRSKQTVVVRRERQPEKEKPREPGVLMPYPTGKDQRVYQVFVEQTIEYTNGERSLKLVEDLRGETTLHSLVNGQEVPRELLWDSPGFTLGPNGDVETALAKLLEP